jgi:predicted dehydrogenase
MRQLTQRLRAGELLIQELALPAVGPGMVLVRNHYSVISAGTEGAAVQTARKSLIGKARARPEQARKVLATLSSLGPVGTFRAVMSRLDALMPLGYSCAGRVLAVGQGVDTLTVGDLVGCGGAGYASHAEVVCVPKNLCARLPADADLKAAAYNTLGAVAMHGVRQADLRIGERCAVIGLGLLGQLTCLLLRASGVEALGVDVDPRAVEAARGCADGAWERSTPNLAALVQDRTQGLGVDGVILTCGTSSLDPINLAGELARKRGRVVVVGAVPTGFDREPYYRKELELRMSCSYGPGRYDPNYEEHGVDYPAAYVRWTEQRNMQAFQELIHSGRVDIGPLTTHVFPFEEAAAAYELILEGEEHSVGVVLEYDVERPLRRGPVEVGPAAAAGRLCLGFLGAGSYAQTLLLPNLPRRASRRTVVTRSGVTGRGVAERFGFARSSTDPADVLADPQVNTVFVATRHDSHGEYALQGLRAGKHVFVEKPLCLRVEELEQIESLYAGEGGPPGQLMVGFNRRFAPHTQALLAELGTGPISAMLRVNAGAVPSSHWAQDPRVGGGRILGEVCHFVDLLTAISRSLPRTVYAVALPDPEGLRDTLSICLGFHDGSVGSISYFANGPRSLPKEYLEVYQGGAAFVLTDFRELVRHQGSKPRRSRSLVQDKGQSSMLTEFLQRVEQGGAPLIPPRELFAVTRACFGVLESLGTGRPVDLAL